MTAPAPPVELCGHRWHIALLCIDALRSRDECEHRCDEPAHPSTTRCRCRCGAETERTPTP